MTPAEADILGWALLAALVALLGIAIAPRTVTMPRGRQGWKRHARGTNGR